MSVIPWLDEVLLSRPSRHQHQLSLLRHPEDYFEAYLPKEILRYPLEELANLQNLVQSSGVSENSDNKFHANVDVQQFKPEEITVKVTGDNTVTVEAKHEEKPDEHGYISRHFVRRYVLPRDCDVKHVKSKLSSDGVLTITAPKIDEEKKIEYREIPVIRTGQPMKKVDQKDATQEAKK